MQKPKEQWLVDLLKEVEGCVDEERLASILEQRGRACISDNYIKKAKAAANDAKDIDEFLDNLAKAVRMLKRKGDVMCRVAIAPVLSAGSRRCSSRLWTNPWRSGLRRLSCEATKSAD
jgi:hypothetical protein